MKEKTTISNTNELQKYFSSVLRKRSKGEATNADTIDPSILKFFTRKELVAILTQKFNGKLPKEVDLVELENEDLLQLIGDDLFILSFLLPKWISQELETQQEASKDAKSAGTATPSSSLGKTEAKKPSDTISSAKEDKKGGKNNEN